jgi:GDP-D-mannose dehydratase
MLQEDDFEAGEAQRYVIATNETRTIREFAEQAFARTVFNIRRQSEKSWK